MKAIPMEVTDDRKTTIEINGELYDLVFNSRAAREISSKYGGLKEFGKAIDQASDAERVSHNVWLCTLLVNQGIAIYNYNNPENKKSFFTEDDIDLLTSPADWQEARNALAKGTNRNIKSEENEKNATVG